MFASIALLLFFAQVTFAINRSDRIVSLKRKTSQVLKLQGIQFDNDIEKIQFDGISWGIVDLSDDMIVIMNAILDDEIYKNNRTLRVKNANGMSNFVIPVSKMVVHQSSVPIYGVYYSRENVKDVRLKRLIESIVSNLTYCEGANFSFLTEKTNVGKKIDDDKYSESSLIIFIESNNVSLNYAQLGMQSNKSSVIHLSKKVSNRTLTSLLLTALGFTNLLWRKDRDKYVTINWRNIDDKYKYLFHQWNVDLFEHVTGTSFVKGFQNPQLTYNYKSSLHFLPTEFAKNIKNFAWTSKNVRQFREVANFKTDSLLVSFEYCPPPGKAGIAGGLCEDNDVKCLSWKDQNCCGQYEVSIKCQRVCSMCELSDPVKCEDINAFCPDWATAYCSKGSKNYDYMNSTCQRSCGCPNFPNDKSKIMGASVRGSWTLVGDSNTVCDHPQQQTFVSTETSCKDWCSSKKLNFCFWDISQDDGFCFGTTACREQKETATPYRRFNLV